MLAAKLSLGEALYHPSRIAPPLDQRGIAFDDTYVIGEAPLRACHPDRSNKVTGRVMFAIDNPQVLFLCAYNAGGAHRRLLANILALK